MRGYTWYITDGDINFIRTRDVTGVGIWIHNGRVMKNRTSWSDQELKHITHNFTDMDAVNYDKHDSYGCPIIEAPIKTNKYMYLLIKY